MAKRYEKVRTIGRGGFSTVYLVKDKKDGGEKCVLKEMDIVQMSAAEQEMAKQEVQVLRSYNHPNIIQYRDNFLHKGKLNIVMEHASGGDLYQRIRKQGSKPLPEAQIRRWTGEILSALKAVHDRKMIHRDLKPQNVFLMADNTVKIGDFGIAKDLANTRAAHTQIGTPFYISPEICHNKSYDSKSDMWSFGCLIHEMCTLKPPFMADDLKAMMKRICYSAPAPIPGQYSKELRELVNSLLNKNPRERPDSEKVARVNWISEILSDIEVMNSPAEVLDYPPLSVASRFDAEASSVAESASVSGGSGNSGCPTDRDDRRGQARVVVREGRGGRERGRSNGREDDEAAAKIQAAFRDSMNWKKERQKGKSGRQKPVKQFRPNPLQIKEKRRASLEEISEGYMAELSEACQRQNPELQQQQQEHYRQQLQQQQYEYRQENHVPPLARGQARRGSAPPWAGHYNQDTQDQYQVAMQHQAKYREAVERRRNSVQDVSSHHQRPYVDQRKAKSHSPAASQYSGASLSPNPYSDPGATLAEDQGLRLPRIHKSVSPPQFANYGDIAPRRGVAAPRERMVAGGGKDGKVSYAPVPPWGGDARFEDKPGIKAVQVRKKNFASRRESV